MKLRRTLAAAMSAAALTMMTNAGANAAPSTTTAIATPRPTNDKQTAHASIGIEIGNPSAKGKAWIGQTLPVTIRAYFREAEAATIEGVPQLSSPGIFTSDIGREPKQSTVVIGDQPVLVATWTGTVTPSTAAPLTMTAELPVRVKYRDPAPQIAMSNAMSQDDFEALTNNPFDTSIFDRMIAQQRAQVLGRLHEETVALRVSAKPIDVRELPTEGQPASFDGAIGRFNVKASLPSTHGQASEPVTLQMVVEGDGDLDRVDLAGVPPSDTWKTYPPKSTIEAAAKGKRARKVFEQVLIPLHGGELTVPPVELASFDPDAGKYLTRTTLPLSMSIAGASAVAAIAPVAAPASLAAEVPVADLVAPMVPPVARPTKVLFGIAPVALLVAAAGLTSLVRRRRGDRTLRRTMRTAASRGEPIAFYKAANTLIRSRLAERWGMAPEAMSAATIHDRLGVAGDAIAEVLLADETLRFGRGQVESPDLVPLCASIERALGGVS